MLVRLWLRVLTFMQLSVFGKIFCGCATGVKPTHVPLPIIITSVVQSNALAGRDNSTRKGIEEDLRWSVSALI